LGVVSGGYAYTREMGDLVNDGCLVSNNSEVFFTLQPHSKDDWVLLHIEFPLSILSFFRQAVQLLFQAAKVSQCLRLHNGCVELAKRSPQFLHQKFQAIGRFWQLLGLQAW